MPLCAYIWLHMPGRPPHYTLHNFPQPKPMDVDGGKWLALAWVGGASGGVLLGGARQAPWTPSGTLGAPGRHAGLRVAPLGGTPGVPGVARDQATSYGAPP